MTNPKAWALSSAGRMPSIRASSRKGVEGLPVAADLVARPPFFLQVAVLRPDAGVVEPRGDGAYLSYLAVVILEEIAHRAVEDARPPAREGCRVGARARPVPPASTPMRATEGSALKPLKMPMAFDPPPTQATT